MSAVVINYFHYILTSLRSGSEIFFSEKETQLEFFLIIGFKGFCRFYVKLSSRVRKIYLNTYLVYSQQKPLQSMNCGVSDVNISCFFSVIPFKQWLHKKIRGNNVSVPVIPYKQWICRKIQENDVNISNIPYGIPYKQCMVRKQRESDVNISWIPNSICPTSMTLT